MPNIKQSIGVLRNGVPKRRAGSTEEDDEADVRLPVRDHYERFEQYMKRQYPKRKQDRFAEERLTKQARTADRSTPLGIIDTIVREFIIFWMPEVELFLADDPYDDEDLEREAYKRLVDGLEEHVMAVSDRVDCDRAGDAATLRDALQERALQYLADLYESCKDVLKDYERSACDPKKRSSRSPKTFNTRKAKPATGILSEARTLDSSLAWSLADNGDGMPSPRSMSPRLRHLSPIRQLDYGDASDNGGAWGDPEAGAGKRKFEIEITNTIKISGSESIEAFRDAPSRTWGMTNDNTVDLTAEDHSGAPLPGGMHLKDWLEGADADQLADASEFSIPGAFDQF